MRVMNRFLSGLVRQGRLTVIYADGTSQSFGEAADGIADVTVRFDDKRAPYAVLRDPRIGAGEMIMDGRLILEQGDIRDLARLIRANSRWEQGGRLQARSSVRRAFERGAAKLDRFNWRSRARRNVVHHYDLSDRLYELFLDRDRQYSCAYFTDPANDLDTAQRDKKAHIVAKLALEPGQRVLDIGCGWGGTALAIHRVTDCEVLGITLSEEQIKIARRRAETAGVADKVRFELMDYRDVEERFDRIVSIGMFEHVGPPHYRRFFAKCRDLLTDDGVMLLHTIGRLGEPGTTDKFTWKYIFPGGYIPALSEIVSASETAHLICSDIETLRLHYGYTLDRWYDRTVAARDEIVAMYDERFYRLWLFYLAGAATVFQDGSMCNYQLQYIRNRRALPITRDYMADDEKRIRAQLAE